MKISFQDTNILLFISVNNTEVVDNSSRNNKKLAKFTKFYLLKIMYNVKKPSILVSDNQLATT